MDAKKSIKEFIINELVHGKKSVTDSEPLLDKGVIDSIGIMRLVAFLEKTFDIRIKDKELVPDNFQSIDTLANFVQKKKSAS